MIRFEHYKKEFADRLILSIPSLELKHGLYWLKGENGSGKTTLIKSLAGLIPFYGSIAVDGRDIRTQRTAYKRLVNYAEAEPLYPAFLTGTDLIRFYASAKKAPEKQIAALTDSLGVSAFAGNKVGTYSSGMAKKLSLVLGFMGEPKLILLDEPLITLDTNSVQMLQHIIEDYYSRGVAFLVTSHQEIRLSAQAPQQLLVKDKTLSVL